MSYTKITQADLTEKGVIGLSDTPNLNTTDMQKKFDEIALDVIVPKFNELSDELDNSGIGDAIQSADITNMRLNADMAIEVSSDEGQTWSGTASSGHRIMDGSGTMYTQRSKMQFSNNVTIRDDAVNNATQIFVQPGDKGDKGDAATITIGNVQGGSTAEVTNSGSRTDAIFNFTFPKGDPGDSATIQVGTVTTGTSASVTNRGTTSNAIFDFILPKGDKGDTGQGINILGEYATLADLQAAHPTGNPGNAYMVGSINPKDLYVWDVGTSSWANQGQLQGVKGDTGDAATITVGTVTTGQTSAVVNSGTTSNAVFDFTLEKGEKGDQGIAGTIAVGSVTSGQTASVTNVGTPEAAVFDFVIPQGPQGPQGNPTTVNGKSGNNVTLYGSDIDLNSGDSTKVDTAISSCNTAIGTKAAKTDLTSIQATGATNTTGSTITAGTYFYLDGVLVRALADIANGATFTLNTNYEVVSAGVLNELGVYRVVATANANQTYASQLTTLNSAFTALTLNEKLRCKILDSAKIFNCSGTAGGFQRITAGTTGSVIVQVMALYDSKYYNGNPPTLGDNSSSTNSNQLQLVIV